jgi:hypothetical protein
LTIGLTGRSGAEAAYAAVKQAASVTADSARASGTAVVRLTHNGELRDDRTIRWHDGDLATSSDIPDRQGKVGSQMLVVDDMMYGIDASDGGWVELGPPESIDPDSGTTPAETLAAVREDVGGEPLSRITDAMQGLATQQTADGSTVYSGSVAAGQVARETGFKEGQSIRVLPFGFVAHDEAADPTAPLNVAVTVGVDGVVQGIAVDWGTSDSAWTFTVEYRDLGSTPAIAAPENASPLKRPLSSTSSAQ